MNNKRQADRRATLYHSQLLDPDTHAVIGNLVDVSEKGLRFMTTRKFSRGTKVELLLALPSQVRGKREHRFTATVRWCQPDVNPEYQAVGVQIEAADDETRIILSYIHDLYCFSA